MTYHSIPLYDFELQHPRQAHKIPTCDRLTMRPTSLATALLTSGLFLTSQAQLVPFFTNSKLVQQRKLEINTHQQHPMENAPGIQLPPQPPNSDSPSNSNNDGNDKGRNSAVILSDVMATSRQTSIFASFCRDIDPVSRRLDSSSQNTTVLAPLNSAISDLPRKPWEDPQEYAAFGAEAYSGKDGEDRAHRNLRRFTESHVVPVSPWGEGERVRSLGGGEVWWEKGEDGVVSVQPGNVQVESVAQKVANGEVWIVRGVVDYAASEQEEQ